MQISSIFYSFITNIFLEVTLKTRGSWTRKCLFFSLPLLLINLWDCTFTTCILLTMEISLFFLRVSKRKCFEKWVCNYSYIPNHLLIHRPCVPIECSYSSFTISPQLSRQNLNHLERQILFAVQWPWCTKNRIFISKSN